MQLPATSAILSASFHVDLTRVRLNIRIVAILSIPVLDWSFDGCMLATSVIMVAAIILVVVVNLAVPSIQRFELIPNLRMAYTMKVLLIAS